MTTSKHSLSLLYYSNKRKMGEHWYKENICEKTVNMSSKRNTMNNNLFRGYQQYAEYHRQTFPFATPPSYQEWNATFKSTIINIIIKCLKSPPSSSNNSDSNNFNS